MTVFLLLVGTSYFLLHTSYIQTLLVHFYTERIEKITGVKMQIGGVDFRPVKSLVLTDVLIKDFKNDTLVACEDLRVKMDYFDFFNKRFVVDEIVFNHAEFNLWVTRGENGADMNIEMFIDSLLKTDTLKSSAKNDKGFDWLIGLKKVSVRDSRFTYCEEEYEEVDYGVNWTDVDCRDLNFDVTGFDFGEERTIFVVSGLTLREKSGLYIKELNGRTDIGSGNLQITQCRILLERSDVDLVKLEFNWNPGQRDWRYFTKRMQQYYELGLSSVSFIDLAYFNGILRGITNTAKCSGVVTNTINQLEGHDIYIEFGENNSMLQGNFRSDGLPKVWNTVFDIDFDWAHVSPADLATVYLPWFEMNIPVPEQLLQFQYVDFANISFDGKISDFILDANSVTPSLNGNLNLTYSPCKDNSNDCSEINGAFNFAQVDAGKLAGFSVLGNAALSGTYDGILDGKGHSFHLKSNIQGLNFNKKYIKDIDLFLTSENNKMSLVSSVDNDIVRGEIMLDYVPGDTLDYMNAKGGIEISNLNDFGLAFTEAEETAGMSFDLKYAGKDRKSATNLFISDLYYSNANAAFNIQNINYVDSLFHKHNKTKLTSDVIDVTIEGDYRDIRPLPFATQLLRNYLPAYSGKIKKSRTKEDMPDFGCVIEVKDVNRILKALYPDLSVSPGMKINAHVLPDDKLLGLSFYVDTVQYKDFNLTHTKVDMVGDDEQLNLNFTADCFEYRNLYRLYNIRDEVFVEENFIDNKLTWSNWSNETYSGQLASSLKFSRDKKNNINTDIEIKPGVIIIADSTWYIDPSFIHINDKNIYVDSFSIHRGSERIFAQGNISEDASQRFIVNLENLSLTDIMKQVFDGQYGLFGMATGSFIIQDYYKDFLLISDFNINDWGINKDTLGTLHLKSYWDADNHNLRLNAENLVDNQMPLTVSGFYAPASDSVNVNINLEKVGLNRLANYIPEYISETSGDISGNLNIVGSLMHPDFSGAMYLDSVKMTVNMLNTGFCIHDSLFITNNRLVFNDFKLTDKEGNPSVFNGEYRIWEQQYKMQGYMSDFLILNTNSSHNETVYGRVFLSGLVELNNLDGLTNVDISARTENNSRLFLPLSAGSNIQANNFLHLINPGQSDIKQEQQAYENTSINLNAHLELNEGLDIQVIFDPTVGDILKTSGKGDIKITFDRHDNLNMFGEYQVTRGDYLFTLSNLVNKKFVLSPGGTITWNGAPYDASLNMEAVYSLKTTVSELLPLERSAEDNEERTSETTRKVPVECILHLSDNLSNPVVKFDINFPSLETQTRSYIQSLFSSQDEINKQMFSLLVLNKFYRTDNTTTDYGSQAQSASVTTVTEMMSNQLSRWLSQISNNWDIGLSYRVRDFDKEITTDELEVALSTQILNDRVTISANGNMDVGGNGGAGKEDKKTNIAGDFDIEVKLNKQGNLKMKAYSHTDEKLLYNRTETIQGVGVSYQESFDTFKELLNKYFAFIRRKKKE